MFTLLATLLTLVTISTSPDSVTIDLDSPVGRIWAEVEISSGSVIEWGT